jgi:hypothetical protein
MKRKREPVSQEEQSRRFIEAAQKAGVEAADDTLERIVRRIAKAPPPKAKKPPRPKR